MYIYIYIYIYTCIYIYTHTYAFTCTYISVQNPSRDMMVYIQSTNMNHSKYYDWVIVDDSNHHQIWRCLKLGHTHNIW